MEKCLCTDNINSLCVLKALAALFLPDHLIHHLSDLPTYSQNLSDHNLVMAITSHLYAVIVLPLWKLKTFISFIVGMCTATPFLRLLV